MIEYRYDPNFSKYLWSAVPWPASEICEKYNLCIAGGWVRDTLAGDPPADIDIFDFSGKRCDIGEEISKMLPAQQHELQHRERLDMILPNDKSLAPIQVIDGRGWEVDNASDLLDRFDFSVNQVALYWDGQPNFIAKDLTLDHIQYKKFDIAPTPKEPVELNRVFSLVSRGWWPWSSVFAQINTISTKKSFKPAKGGDMYSDAVLAGQAAEIINHDNPVVQGGFIVQDLDFDNRVVQFGAVGPF